MSCVCARIEVFGSPNLNTSLTSSRNFSLRFLRSYMCSLQILSFFLVTVRDLWFPILSLLVHACALGYNLGFLGARVLWADVPDSFRGDFCSRYQSSLSLSGGYRLAVLRRFELVGQGKAILAGGTAIFRRIVLPLCDCWKSDSRMVHLEIQVSS